MRLLLPVPAALAVLALAASLTTAAAQDRTRPNPFRELVASGKVAFGWFATAATPDAAAKAAANAQIDFVFLNMEQVESYNPAAVKAFLGALNGKHPLMVRLPIFHADPQAAKTRAAEMLKQGAAAIVFPDMESGDEARQALAAIGPAASVFIVESEKGIANSREITRERPTVAIPGPGTLRRVYQGDMAKVEQAIQTQLASCKEFNVACGITAGPADVEKRIKEGFRVIIVYDRDAAETLRIGRAAAGRDRS